MIDAYEASCKYLQNVANILGVAHPRLAECREAQKKLIIGSILGVRLGTADAVAMFEKLGEVTEAYTAGDRQEFFWSFVT